MRGGDTAGLIEANCHFVCWLFCFPFLMTAECLHRSVGVILPLQSFGLYLGIKIVWVLDEIKLHPKYFSIVMLLHWDPPLSNQTIAIVSVWYHFTNVNIIRRSPFELSLPRSQSTIGILYLIKSKSKLPIISWVWYLIIPPKHPTRSCSQLRKKSTTSTS